MNTLIFLAFGLVLFIVAYFTWDRRSESFDIPLRSSSAWDWNLGPGYGAGYGTGYAMWGMWPANLPLEPWKNWMWGRRPLIFKKPFTPAPQIDYNNAPYNSKPISNYNVSILPVKGEPTLAVSGMASKTLQLDRNRPYYFHIFAPGMTFAITDQQGNPVIDPLSEGTVQITFTNEDPDVLYYTDMQGTGKGGIIYLNNTRWI